jgi:hypothetical protein
MAGGHPAAGRTVNAKIAANSPCSDIRPRVGATSAYGSLLIGTPNNWLFQAVRIDDTKLMSANRTF